MNLRNLLSNLAVVGVAALLLVLAITSSSNVNADHGRGGGGQDGAGGSLLGHRGQSQQQRLAKKIAGTWFGNDGAALQNYLQLSADGNMLSSTTGELGSLIVQLPNPMAGEEGQPDTFPFSLQGTHTPIYGRWWATGRNTFEVYGSSMYHRPAEFDAPPINPAPLTGIFRFWFQGEVIDGQIRRHGNRLSIPVTLKTGVLTLRRIPYPSMNHRSPIIQHGL